MALTRWAIDTRPLWQGGVEFQSSLSLLPENERAGVLRKRFNSDRKMSLASLLLQRYYIVQSTGEKWESIKIQHTPQNKPYFRDLQYNVSHTDGIVVLVGFEYPVGIDIVRRDLATTELSISDLESIFSSYERKSLSECENICAFNDLYLMTWAFKEAYMKSTGIPDWDKLASIEFRDIRLPPTNNSCIINPVSKVFIHGYQKAAYTESHTLENVYFIAIFTSISPVEENRGFTWIVLEDIVDSLTRYSKT